MMSIMNSAMKIVIFRSSKIQQRLQYAKHDAVKNHQTDDNIVN